MVRHTLALAKAQDFTQRQTVSTAPPQPALAINAFEIAHQQHVEVAPLQQRQSTTAARAYIDAHRLSTNSSKADAISTACNLS